VNSHQLKKETELDVDFIGEQKPITAEQEKILSDFFKQKKLENDKKESVSKIKLVRKRRENA
jgi:hypothetical protein